MQKAQKSKSELYEYSERKALEVVHTQFTATEETAYAVSHKLRRGERKSYQNSPATRSKNCVHRHHLLVISAMVGLVLAAGLFRSFRSR